MTDQHHDHQQCSPAEVAHLFDIACREAEAIALLEGCVATLREVQQAKAILKGLPIADLRAGLEFRRRILGGDPA